MRWAIGTPWLNGKNWVFFVGIMRVNNEMTFHFGVFWVMIGWA